MKSNILVTGGCGFIGSHIVDSYINDGYQVVIIDNLSSGKIANKHKDATFYYESLGCPNLIEEVIEKHQINIIHHAAARPRVKYSVDFPIETTEENITNTVRVLDAARKHKVKRVVYSASSSAYGNIEIPPFIEGKEGKVQSPYALQKRVGEEYCQLYSQLYSLDTVCLRYFNVFGPRSTAQSEYSAVIPIFIEQIFNGSPITIHGNGLQSRDFTYIDNVVRANRLAAKYTKDLIGDIFNVGCGDSYSINDLAVHLENLLGVKGAERVYQDSRPGDVYLTCASIDKIQRTFGYTPSIDFEEGLKKTIKWYTRYLEE